MTLSGIIFFWKSLILSPWISEVKLRLEEVKSINPTTTSSQCRHVASRIQLLHCGSCIFQVASCNLFVFVIEFKM